MSGGGFFRSTSIVGAFTLVSRVTGLLRDMVYSRMFGAGLLMDAFLVAFKIPNFMRRLFAEGAFSQAFVPVVSEYKVQREHDEVRELVDGAMGTMAWFLSVVTIIGVIAAPVLVFLFAPGFRADGARFDLTVEMLRWTFPYILFISLAALAGGVLNSYGKFAVPATTLDAHEPRHDRVCRLDRAALRAAWHRAGDRRARFGHRAAGVPAAVHDQARPVATAALALGTRGRAQDRAADAAGHFWLVRVAGCVAARYADRFVPHRRAASPGSITPTGSSSFRLACSASRSRP